MQFVSVSSYAMYVASVTIYHDQQKICVQFFFFYSSPSAALVSFAFLLINAHAGISHHHPADLQYSGFTTAGCMASLGCVC